MIKVSNHTRDNIERWEYLMLKDEVAELKKEISRLNDIVSKNNLNAS